MVLKYQSPHKTTTTIQNLCKLNPGPLITVLRKLLWRPDNTKITLKITFVVTQRKVEVAGDGRSQGEQKAMATQWFIFIHRTDGLDHLRKGTPKDNPHVTVRHIS